MRVRQVSRVRRRCGWPASRMPCPSGRTSTPKSTTRALPAATYRTGRATRRGSQSASTSGSEPADRARLTAGILDSPLCPSGTRPNKGLIMRILDSHFHWWPRSVFDALCKREGYPRAESNGKGGYTYSRQEGGAARFNLGAECFDLDKQMAHMDGLGYEVDVVCSTGPFSLHFSDLPVDEGRAAAMLWNEEMADAQRRYPGRLWA